MSTMPLYQQRTRAGNERNPARALYSHWLTILRGRWDVSGKWPQGHTLWGRSRDCGIGVVKPETTGLGSDWWLQEYGTFERPTLGFGYIWRDSSLSPMMRIHSTGDFQVSGSLHGAHQRDLVANNTFLDWIFYASQYQWLVNTSNERINWRHNLLTAWRAPVHYIGERSVIGRGWSRTPIWLKLERADAQWAIRYSRPSLLPHPPYFAPATTKEQAEAYEALRLRRYERMRREELIRNGELVIQGRKILSAAEIDERLNRQALAIAAHMNVSQPAKTTSLQPLRRR